LITTDFTEFTDGKHRLVRGTRAIHGYMSLVAALRPWENRSNNPNQKNFEQENDDFDDLVCGG
jgi:hypothetical protein